jgi:tripartite-type tricarboxylate transporter receptor subunit TctC
VPTIEELGYNIPNLTHITSLTGIVAPKGFGGPAMAKLEAALAKVYRDPAFETQMKNISAPIDILGSKAYEAEVMESAKVAEKIYPALMKETK